MFFFKLSIEFSFYDNTVSNKKVKNKKAKKVSNKELLQQCLNRTTGRGLAAAGRPAHENPRDAHCVLRFRRLAIRYKHAPIACPSSESSGSSSRCRPASRTTGPTPNNGSFVTAI